jgi:hypothetical protein
MHRKRYATIVCITLTAVFCARPRHAHAGETQPEVAYRYQVRLDGGVASALGFGGIAFVYSPLRSVELEAGTGVGITGVQLSFMPKLAIGSVHNRFVTGVGLAYATETAYPTGTHPIWLNADLLGFEHRGSSGFTFLATAGYTISLQGRFCDTSPFEGCGGGDARYKTVGAIQGRLGVGYSF